MVAPVLIGQGKHTRLIMDKIPYCGECSIQMDDYVVWPCPAVAKYDDHVVGPPSLTGTVYCTICGPLKADAVEAHAKEHNVETIMEGNDHA